jgi:hypothetical protein
MQLTGKRLKDGITHLPSMDGPALMAAITERGQSVLRFATVVNEMKKMRPEPLGNFYGTEEQQRVQALVLSLFLVSLVLFAIFQFKKVTLTDRNVSIWIIIFFAATFADVILFALFGHLNFVTGPFEDDVKFAIKRALSNYGLPIRDLPSVQMFAKDFYRLTFKGTFALELNSTEAAYRSYRKLRTLAPPSNQSSGCDLLYNPGTDSRHVLTKGVFWYD